MALKKCVDQATLPIHFAIVGGGISGLTCAIALRRVGHQVTVLESHASLQQAAGACRIAPNMSKILYHWGLKNEVRSIATKSKTISLLLYESGEILGRQHWDEEVIKETRGEFVFAHYSDLRKLLYDTAVSCGAKIRMNTTVVSIDPYKPTITLHSGEVLEADVIVGADGPSGLTRREVDKTMTEPVPGRLKMFSTTVPKELIMKDPELAYIYKQKNVTMFNWFGNGRSVLGFPVGDGSEFAMYIYCPCDDWKGIKGSWSNIVPGHDLESKLSTAEPRLQKLGELVSSAICIPVEGYPLLEDWVHERGRLVVIGDAAHPLPPGANQSCALAVEDGAVLGTLFSHLRREDQISHFLWAFQDIRQPRCDSIVVKENGLLHFMTMPPGEHQQMRDSSMRAKRDGGIGILQESDEYEESPEWVEIKEIFGYDAEDEANNWWVEWGMLRERSKGITHESHVPTVYVDS